MTTLQQNGKPTQVRSTKSTSHKPISRKLHWLHRSVNGGGIIQMRITYKNRTELFRYRLDPIPNPCGLGARWRKLGFAGEVLEDYSTLIENAQDHTCECRGFLRWGKCKHVEALQALSARGDI